MIYISLMIFYRICYIEDSMLWTGSIQWCWSLHTLIQLMPQQRYLCLLGSIPSLREGQQDHCSADILRLPPVHAPNESQCFTGNGIQQDLKLDCYSICSDLFCLLKALWLFMLVFVCKIVTIFNYKTGVNFENYISMQ